MIVKVIVSKICVYGILTFGANLVRINVKEVYLTPKPIPHPCVQVDCKPVPCEPVPCDPQPIQHDTTIKYQVIKIPYLIKRTDTVVRHDTVIRDHYIFEKKR